LEHRNLEASILVDRLTMVSSIAHAITAEWLFRFLWYL